MIVCNYLFRQYKIIRDYEKTKYLDDYLSQIELISFKSFKSGKLNDSFSFSAEDKNMNSSFSMLGNNNKYFNSNFGGGNYNVNQSLLSEQNFITYNNNNINNSSFL